MSLLNKILSKVKGLMSAPVEENSSDIMKNGESYFSRAVINTSKSEKVIIFDVGANVGGYTENLLQKLKELNVTDFEIHLFEPQKICYQTLLDKFSNQKNLVINNFALSDAIGTATIHADFEGSSWGSLYDRDGLNLNVKEEIKLRTLQDYVAEKNITKIHLLKIDTEGNELKVLKGAENKLNPDFVNFVQFEYGGCYLDAKITLKEVVSLLIGKKYKVGKLKSSSIAYLANQDKVIEDYIYSNYVAVKTQLN